MSAARIELFSLLAAGERLAERAARAEAVLVGDARLAMLFRRQAEQEHQHARVFDLVLRYLGGEAEASNLAASPLTCRIDMALLRGDLPSLVLATQGVLEGVGVALLEAMNLDAHPRGRWLEPFHRAVLAQERAHQRIGERATAMLVRSGAIGWTSVECTLAHSLADGLQLIDRHADLALRLAKPIAASRRAVREHVEQFLEGARAA